MALKAGRVGVNPSQVDMAGNVIGGGGNTYTKLEIDQMLGSKVGIGQLEANNKDFYFAYDETSQKYGYKLDGTGDFHPFEEGGSGGIGWVKPPNLSATGLTPSSNITIIEGGIAIIDDMCYVDIVYRKTSSSAASIDGFPKTNYYATGSLIAFACSSQQSDIDDYFYNASIAESASIGNSTDYGILSDGYASNYKRVIGMYPVKRS